MEQPAMKAITLDEQIGLVRGWLASYSRDPTMQTTPQMKREVQAILASLTRLRDVQRENERLQADAECAAEQFHALEDEHVKSQRELEACKHLLSLVHAQSSHDGTITAPLRDQIDAKLSKEQQHE